MPRGKAGAGIYPRIYKRNIPPRPTDGPCHSERRVGMGPTLKRAATKPITGTARAAPKGPHVRTNNKGGQACAALLLPHARSNMRRAAIGFKGLALAPVTENTLTSYAASAGEALPYAGSMSRTAKESTTDLYYDDDLYAQIKNVSGEDVEIRVAEVPLERMAALGLGDYDEDTNTLEGDFSVAGKEYALRCVVDTVDHLPYYFNYRVFQLTGIRFDNFTTKQDSVTVCEVIITGVFKRPALPSLKPYAVMQLADDRSNEAACTAFLTAEESKPGA